MNRMINYGYNIENDHLDVDAGDNNDADDDADDDMTDNNKRVDDDYFL